jgi:predicted enzyme related to lactoylglutathione lyase/predicted SnoaL-like aldol condensation-catalyzing enzyme
MMRLNGVCLITPDVPRLYDFYRQVLQMEPGGDDSFAGFETQRASLSLYHLEGMLQMAPGSMQGTQHSFTLEFEVDDVDAEYRRLLDLNVEIVKPPTTQPWGWRSVWFRDPAGNIVNFCSYVGADKPLDPKAVVRDYFQRLLNERDLSVCDELLAPDYRDHDAPDDTPRGPQSTKEYVAGFLADYPDLHVEVLDVMAEDHQAAARLVWRGTHKDSGEPLNREGVVWLRLDEQGRLVERW